jgi:hypothetical protein
MYEVFVIRHVVIASRSCTLLNANLPGLEVISCVTLPFLYGCLQHTVSERTFAVWEKGKIRAGQDGVSTGRAQALVFVCELKTGGTKSLCAPVRRLGAKESLKFGIKISLRCQVGAATLDCATSRPFYTEKKHRCGRNM